MSAQIEAAEILRELVGPPAFGAGNVKDAVRRAAEITRLPFGRVRRLWNREAIPRVEEMDRLRDLARTRQARLARQQAEADVLTAAFENLIREFDGVRLELAALRRRVDGEAADAAGAPARF